VLKPGGLLTFTTFGPDTLVELRRAWAAAADGHTHVNRFIDMHDLGDALVRSGLAEPVLDVERYTLDLCDGARPDARPEGDRCPQRQRRATAGLTGRGAFERMVAAYETCRREDRLPATYEVVFGQAGAGRSEPAQGLPGEVRVPVGRIGRRAGRPDPASESEKLYNQQSNLKLVELLYQFSD